MTTDAELPDFGADDGTGRAGGGGDAMEDDRLVAGAEGAGWNPAWSVPTGPTSTTFGGGGGGMGADGSGTLLDGHGGGGGGGGGGAWNDGMGCCSTGWLATGRAVDSGAGIAVESGYAG